MVNGPSETESLERRERSRSEASAASILGSANLNPFGDLHAVQHLSARLARSMRAVFEPFLRRETRVWAEPLVVQRFADYRAERPDGLTAWLPMPMQPTGGQSLAVFDGKFVLELLDLFFGGTGAAPHPLPAEFTPAAEAMVKRLGASFMPALKSAWEPIARIDFGLGNVEANAAMLADLDGDDAMVITRFGIATADDKPSFLDLIYPVAALKPHGASLTGKVVGKSGGQDLAWQNGLTRSVMNVRFPVRSVLAEPVISLGRLMELKEGDVIPIHFGEEVPVMVANDRLGTGTVGTSNGRAAIRINTITRIDEEDFR
jgi:flagellar motor switch protein FliM